MVALSLGLLSSCVALLTPARVSTGSETTAIGRRAALLLGATAPLALRPAAHASEMAIDIQGDWLPYANQDTSWADHKGPFTADFFKDFKTADTGFAYKFLQEGSGDKPVPFQKVFVHYTGYLVDGTQFDTSYPGEPFRFRLAKGKVIPGWESIVVGMKPGMRVVVRIPYKYAYGDKGIGKIPPQSDLIFYMELVKLGNIKGDKPRLGATNGEAISGDD